MRTREKENRSKETKPESTHLAIFFFTKQKEDLAGGTMAAKTSPPLGGSSGIVGTGAPEEADTEAPEELGTRAMEELGTRATEELNTEATEEVSVGTSEEPIPDVRLLQKDQDQKSRQRGGIQRHENMKTTHRHMIRGTSSSSSSSVSSKATRAPTEKRKKALGSR